MGSASPGQPMSPMHPGSERHGCGSFLDVSGREVPTQSLRFGRPASRIAGPRLSVVFTSQALLLCYGNLRNLIAIVSCLLLVMPIVSFLTLQIQVSWFCFVLFSSQLFLKLPLVYLSLHPQTRARWIFDTYTPILPSPRWRDVLVSHCTQDQVQVPECT